MVRVAENIFECSEPVTQIYSQGVVVGRVDKAADIELEEMKRAVVYIESRETFYHPFLSLRLTTPLTSLLPSCLIGNYTTPADTNPV